MQTGLRHPRTTEFLELAQRVGWKKADLARQLSKSRGYITHIYDEKRVPSESLLDLLRHKVNAALSQQDQIESENQNAVGIPPSAINEKLSYLREHDPSGFRVATNTIETLHQRAVDEVILHEKKKAKRTSSTAVSGLAASSDEALKKMESAGSEEPEQLRGVGERPVHKPLPHTTSSPPAKAPRTARGGKGQT